MPTVKVNDINMYYEIHGHGEPLVLIAGLASDHAMYRGIVPQLAKQYQVILFDNRGVGQTDKPNIPYTIEMMADDTAGLLSALGIDQAHILGTSMGGRIAEALALQHPRQVRSLILVSTVMTQLQGTPMSWSRRLMLLSLKSPLIRGSQPYYAAARQREASSSYDCMERLHEIRVPTLILHGKNDNIAPYKLAQDMHAGIQGAHMITFDGGHLFLFLKQAPFLNAVTTFLRSMSDTSPIATVPQLREASHSMETGESPTELGDIPIGTEEPIMVPRLATLSLSGIAVFTVLVGVEHILRPDYNPLSRYVSEYAVGRYHQVMTTAFFALFFGSAILLVDLTRTLPKDARSTGGLACLGIWSGTIVVAGIFPTDLAGPDGLPEHPTTRGTIHGIAGIVGMASLPLAGILLGRRFRRDPAWRPLARPSIILGMLEYATLVLFLVSSGRHKGITERLLIVADLIWLTWMGRALRTRIKPQ